MSDFLKCAMIGHVHIMTGFCQVSDSDFEAWTIIYTEHAQEALLMQTFPSPSHIHPLGGVPHAIHPSRSRARIITIVPFTRHLIQLNSGYNKMTSFAQTLADRKLQAYFI